jgi:hypothetical protein
MRASTRPRTTRGRLCDELCSLRHANAASIRTSRWRSRCSSLAPASSSTSSSTTSFARIVIATGSRIKRSALHSASRCSLHITASATVAGSARAQHFTRSKIGTDLPVPLAEPADVNNGGAS